MKTNAHQSPTRPPFTRLVRSGFVVLESFGVVEVVGGPGRQGGGGGGTPSVDAQTVLIIKFWVLSPFKFRRDPEAQNP